jgi:hypothetical protein
VSAFFILSDFYEPNIPPQKRCRLNKFGKLSEISGCLNIQSTLEKSPVLAVDDLLGYL